jgi:hypothetical protein
MIGCVAESLEYANAGVAGSLCELEVWRTKPRQLEPQALGINCEQAECARLMSHDTVII